MSQKIAKEKLLDAASKQLFPDIRFEENIKRGNLVPEAFIKRNYIIRQANLNDMNFLMEIESVCWADGMRADRTEIIQRLEDPACLNLVVEYEGKVTGVLYTQRLYEKNIKKVSSVNLKKYRDINGDCIQAITLNVLPEYQDRGWGYQLLEFALEYYSLSDDIKTVCAVTRCRDAAKSDCATQLEYMKNIFHNNMFDDPILKFHQLHGAKVIGLIPNYRPNDIENQGYGVLVKYDIKKRPWQGNITSEIAKKKLENAGGLFLDYVQEKLKTNQINKEKTLSDLGFDSLDMTEMLIFFNEKVGFPISIKQLEDNSIQELWELCNNENQEEKPDIKKEPLKKRIRSIMRKYPELVPLSLEGDGLCTFWIHPLAGDVGVYRTLANQLNDSFRMLAIKSCGLLSREKKPYTSVKEMAKYYCEILEAVDSKGPYHLAGFSFGGTIAYEMARQLEQKGKKVETLLMVESPYIRDEDRNLFQTSYRNNILTNANFLLVTMMRNEIAQKEKQGEVDLSFYKITNEVVKDISDEDLISAVVSICKEKGLLQSKEELEFKLRSMSEVHKANLEAIREYRQEKIKHPEEIKVWLVRTEGAKAISNSIHNPEYLENIQKERGSILPLLKGWNEVFPELHTVVLEGSNHMDIFHSDDSVKKFYSCCETLYMGSDSETKQTRTFYPEIAIIGMSGRFPDAENVDELWENLKNGHSSVRKAPNDRGWNIDDYYNPETKVPGKTYARAGGFLKDIDKFDPLFFKMSPRDAELVDPSERIFLEEAWKAVEDAGYSPNSISGKSWGVFACAKGDYPLLIEKELGQYYIPTNSYAATRLSYLLNLTGPAMTLDTACSSTATAVAEACNSLLLGDCETAIVGGGGVYSTPDILIGSSQSLLLSPDEVCYAFDKRANGTVIAEAVGALILKPLDKAKRDRDHIYGVIKGWGINQDGKTNGMTAPSGIAQTKLQIGVYDKFHINPENITMVEAHGTGTSLGDAIEYQALKDSYSNYTNKTNFCALCSVKTNIGHAFFGSGIVGIIKILLSMKNKQIPPILNYENPSSKIDTINSPFYITTNLSEWKVHSENKRLAAMNSFGATGTNVHLVIEEYASEFHETLVNAEPVVIVVSAKNKDRLYEYVKLLLNALEKTSTSYVTLSDIAYTLQIGRDAMEERIAFVVETVEELKNVLRMYLTETQENRSFYSGCVKTKLIGTEKAEAQRRVKNILQNFRNKSELNELARFWVQGINLDWNSLYILNKPKRISLPTYPFAKERCWIKINDKPVQNISKKIISTAQPDEKLETLQDIMMFVEKWKEKPVLQTNLQDGSTIICFLSEEKNKDIIRRQIKVQYSDVKIIFISQGRESGKESDEQYYIVKEDESSYESVFGEIYSKRCTVSSILYLWAYEDKECIKDYRIIMTLIQTISKTKLQADMLLLCGQYGNELERCYLESWIGFERSLGPMISRTRVKVLIEEKETEFVKLNAERLLCESGTVKRNKSVLWKSDRRYETSLTEVVAKKKESAIKTGGTYLITGGLGGLGFIFAQYLAKTYNAKLILSGRSALDDNKHRRLKAIRNLGGKAMYIQADVCEKNKMEILLDEAVSLFGEINGIIHTAGTSGKCGIYEKSFEEFEDTISSKIYGVQVLAELFEKKKLDFICYFSSSSAILGDFGMCDYAVGNRFMMSYAKYRSNLAEKQKELGKTIAINWPLWHHGGMSLGDESDDLYLKKSGQRFLENEEGIKAFETILSQPEPQYLVMTGQRELVYKMLKLEGEQKDKLNITVEENTGDSLENKMEEYVEQDLKKLISNQYSIPIEKLNSEEHLMEYGFDSINLYEFAKRLSEYYKVNITPSALLGCTTLQSIQEFLVQDYHKELTEFYKHKIICPDSKEKTLIDRVETVKGRESEYVAVKYKEQEKNSVSSASSKEPIAIIGLSGRFPQADSVEEFWNKLKNKSECITEVPEIRWNWREYYSDTDCAEGKSNSKWGGFLNEIDDFDPRFFKILPDEAYFMDPCQRLFLQEAWNTFEDAGYAGEAIRGTSCGVYVGIEEGDYDSLIRQSGQVYSNQNAMLSARIANILDLKGPNMSITASCSSGLVALHQACQAILAEDCEMALAGGIALLITPKTHVGMSTLELLSPTGKSSVFDKCADGMVPAEAVVSVLLKPLSKAVRDKDHIYGCILGSGINYNGQGAGMMAPNPAREAELMETVFKRCHIEPSDIQFVIGHSVGSRMGDSAEVEALRRAFGRSSEKTCYLSSVKPIIGHTFAASGLVNLTAMLMSMKHNTIFGLHNYKNCSEDIDFTRTPFIVQNENTSWTKLATTPRIGVVGTSANSGTNAFAVIGEYINPSIEEYSTTIRNIEEQIVVYSATDENQLRQIVEKHLDYMKENTSVQLADVAYTLQIGREAMNYRLAMVVKNKEELITAMENYLMVDKAQKENKVSIPLFVGRVQEKGFYANNRALLRYEKAVIKEAIKNYDYETVAMQWVLGKQIDWNLLHSKKRNKVSLPTFPFKKEHYWIQVIDTGNTEDRCGEKSVKEVEAKVPVIGNSITKFLAEKFRIPTEELDFNKPLIEYGADSIFMMRFKRFIENTYKIKLSNRDFIKYPTIHSISVYLEEKLNTEIQFLKQDESVNTKTQYADYQDDEIITVLEKYEHGIISLEELGNLIGGDKYDNG
ncbi:MAG: SDR family NAD(P)-dependent oxidoreductase [Acutalibacteraceae bacterium]|nr:SDR family NAD(P)-dependent oxidoreductase [Acutalibacteraceae bacterium]